MKGQTARTGPPRGFILALLGNTIGVHHGLTLSLKGLLIVDGQLTRSDELAAGEPRWASANRNHAQAKGAPRRSDKSGRPSLRGQGNCIEKQAHGMSPHGWLKSDPGLMLFCFISL